MQHERNDYTQGQVLLKNGISLPVVLNAPYWLQGAGEEREN
jgi:hypothetical protein